MVYLLSNSGIFFFLFFLDDGSETESFPSRSVTFSQEAPEEEDGAENLSSAVLPTEEVKHEDEDQQGHFFASQHKNLSGLSNQFLNN